MSEETRTWLITGTSRGIGLGLVTELIRSPQNTVIAACRNPEGASKLHALTETANGRLHVVRLDTSDEASILAAIPKVKELLGEQGLDYVVQNAAITAGDDRAFNFKLDNLLDNFKTNVAGPAVLTNALLPLILRGGRKVVANITSGLASFALDFGPKNMSYSVSKTALNMLVYKQAKENPELIAFVIDPGWVKTDMGGPEAQLELHESVSGLLKVFEGARPEHTAGYFKYDGARTLKGGYISAELASVMPNIGEVNIACSVSKTALYMQTHEQAK